MTSGTSGVYVRPSQNFTIYLYDRIGRTNETITPNIKVFPNPVVSELQIEISVAEAGTAALTVFTGNGQKLISNKVPVASGSNIIKLGNLAHLAKGLYFIEVRTGTNNFKTKFIK
jgi:hypothetical protein